MFTSPFPSRDTSLAPFHGPAVLHLWLCFARPGCVTIMQQSQQRRNKASKAAADEQKFRVRGALTHPPHCSNTCYILRVMTLQWSIQTCLFMKNSVRICWPFMPQHELTEGLSLNPDMSCKPVLRLIHSFDIHAFQPVPSSIKTIMVTMETIALSSPRHWNLP